MEQDSYLAEKLVEYVEKRGIPMPHYTDGSKITEEAEELREALRIFNADPSAENLQALQDEVADVVITAAVVANQFRFTVEDALEGKIARDEARGAKPGEDESAENAQLLNREDRYLVLQILDRTPSDFRKELSLADELDITRAELSIILRALREEGLVRQPVWMKRNEVTWWRLTSRGTTWQEKFRMATNGLRARNHQAP